MAKEEQPKTTSTAMTMAVDHGGMLRPSCLTEAIDLAKMVAHSGMVPKQYEGNVGGVLIAMQMGAEVGLAPLSAVQNIAVINGRPSIWGDAMLALCLAHPTCEDIVEEDHADIAKNGSATCIAKRRGRAPVKRTFSVEDAKKAGLWGKGGPWSQYPNRMLQMRARGFALRDAFPDALRGIISTEEARDITNVVEAKAEWADELSQGTHSFKRNAEPEKAKEPAREKTTPAPVPVPTPIPAPEPEPEPEHDTETGEVADTAAAKCVRVMAAKTTGDLAKLFDGEERKTVKAAIKKRLAELQAERSEREAQNTAPEQLPTPPDDVDQEREDADAPSSSGGEQEPFGW